MSVSESGNRLREAVQDSDVGGWDDEIYNIRILSKVQKTVWSCTHVNSFQTYALYVNQHILLNI